MNKNKLGVVTSRRYSCSKKGERIEIIVEGKKKRVRRPSRFNCQAKMNVVLDKTKQKYVVNNFDENHNHLLHIPECVHLMRSQRDVAKTQAIEIELAYNSGIKSKQTHELMSRQTGGKDYVGHTRSDQKNHLQTKRQRDMKYGEAASLLLYFQKQLSENPSFFYAVQLDNDEQITNIFWADAKMIIDYAQFGEVVTFDTTYKTNSSYRPCGVFASFNHHRQAVIFGATLMYDETTPSFEWLFCSFLDAMS